MGLRGERFIITGASGHLGRLVTERVLERHGPEQVILVTRRPEALADVAARGVEVRAGDFNDVHTLPAALAGGSRMLLISATDLTRRTDQHRAAIDAATVAGVEHVIYTSMIAPEPPNPAVIAPSHYATEQHLLRSGLSWTVLRNNLYAEYQVQEAARAIATGSFIHNRGDGPVAYVARTDCAAVAAAILTGGGHHGCVYEITGPDSCAPPALAALYSDVSGRRVDAIAVDDAAFVQGMLGASAADDHARFGAELVASLGHAAREGYFARCTKQVEQLSGRPARSLRDVLTSGLRAMQA
jgi:NAD(P)H dehydrogenase (quinone)